MIHPEALKYFIEVAHTQHMSRAAERLGVTQPTLSHSLKKLEDDVGYELFHRSKKGMSLTPAGQKLYDKARELLQLWEATLTSVHEEVEEVAGKIRVGCHSAVAQYTLPAFLPQLLSQHPKLKITLTHGLSRHMTEMVVSSQLDIAIAVNPRPHPDLVIKELTRDQVTVWMPKGCQNKDVLLVDANLLQSQDILSRMAKRGLHFERLIEGTSLEVIAQLMSAGTGCGILPERVVKAFSDLKATPVKDAPVFEDRICAVYKPEFRKLKRGESFLQALYKAF